MIAIIIIVLALVVISASLANGHWEVAAIFGGIAVLLLLMGAGERHDVRAHLNWLNYWADGTPPPWRRKMDSSERFERAGRVSKREMDEAVTKREAYIAHEQQRRSGTIHAQLEGNKTAFVCHYCGRYVKAKSDYAYTSEGRMRIYRCPQCGRQNVTKI